MTDTMYPMAPPELPSFFRWQLLFASAGALALGVQTYLLREFLVLLQGDEMAVGLGLASWFVGISVGAWGVTKLSFHARHLPLPGLNLLAVLGCVEVPLARYVSALIALAPFEPLPLNSAVMASALIFLLPGACVGATFVGLAALSRLRFHDAPHAIGNLYIFEALGSLAAGSLLSFLLLSNMAQLRGMLIISGISLLAALAPFSQKHQRFARAAMMVPVVAIAVALSNLPTLIERATETARFSKLTNNSPLLAARHTPYQHLALGASTPHALFADGRYVTSFPEPIENELLANELLLLSPHPRIVLCLAGVETGLLRFILEHPVEQLDLVLLDQSAFELIQMHLATEDRRALADPRVSLHFEDPRRFLLRIHHRYDLILSLAPPPETLFLARTTSAKFNRLVLSRLGPEGTYVTRFLAGANVQSGETGRLGATLYRTLASVFPVVLATPGPDAYFVAGRANSYVTLDAVELSRRYQARGLSSSLFSTALLPELLPKERITQINLELRRDSERLEEAQDNRPLAFLHALTLRHRIENSALANLLEFAFTHCYLLVALLLAPSITLLLLSLLRRRRRKVHLSIYHAIAVTGATGLMGCLLLLVSFQTQLGALYSELGALNGLFMLGLAVGGYLGTRFTFRAPLLRAQQTALFSNFALFVALVVLSQYEAGTLAQWATHAVLLMGVGLGTGMQFPAAAKELGRASSESPDLSAVSVAARLEFWDHGGAAIAALLGAILVIPSLGLLQTAALMVTLQGVALTLTVAARRAV